MSDIIKNIKIGDDLRVRGSGFYLHVLRVTNRGICYAIPGIDEQVWFKEWNKFIGKWEIIDIAIRDREETNHDI